ncbi:hypothetical protein BSY18_3938 (plasmid) [Blastomonas sp. RAC04]|nr:hypothetical protein BSY18_3938 [Blastomonas sp. RAC04]
MEFRQKQRLIGGYGRYEHGLHRHDPGGVAGVTMNPHPYFPR